MKKLICVVLAICLMGFLSGCKSNGKRDDGEYVEVVGNLVVENGFHKLLDEATVVERGSSVKEKLDK